MNSIKTAVLRIAFLSILAPSFAHATVLTTGCINSTSCTVQELFNGGQIQIDDLIFSNFLPAFPNIFESPPASVIFSLGGSQEYPPGAPGSEGFPADPENIVVTGIGEGTADLGIRFNANEEWTVGGDLGGAQASMFSYQVNVTNSGQITSNTLVYEPGTFIPGPGDNESDVQEYLLSNPISDSSQFLSLIDPASFDEFEQLQFLIPDAILGSKKTFNRKAEISGACPRAG